MRNELQCYLEEKPVARERRFKDRGIVFFLLRRLNHEPLETQTLTTDELIDLVKDFNSADRYWRMLLAEYPHLRGTDYNDKHEYEQRKELSLGYEAGYYHDTKR